MCIAVVRNQQSRTLYSSAAGVSGMRISLSPSMTMRDVSLRPPKHCIDRLWSSAGLSHELIEARKADTAPGSVDFVRSASTYKLHADFAASKTSRAQRSGDPSQTIARS